MAPNGPDPEDTSIPDSVGVETGGGEGKEKGKSKEKEPVIPSVHALAAGSYDDSTYSASSLGTRIFHSAHHVAGSLIPSPADFGQTMRTHLADKGEPPGGVSSSSTFDASGSMSSSSGPSQDFRSQHIKEHVARQETQFSDFLHGVDTFNMPASPTTLSGRSNVGLIGREGRNCRAPDAVEYAREDGLPVVKLLNSSYEEVLFPHDDDYISDDQAESLRRALFVEKGRHLDVNWDKLLNFVPDYLTDGTSTSAAGARYENFGTYDPEEIRSLWATQWHDVLTSYIDVVWGDMTHLVKSATKELEQLADNPADQPISNFKSLRRLQQILVHLRNR